MRQIGFDKKFSLLAQEAHLAKNTLLSGFDLLLKANFYQDKDGFSFFIDRWTEITKFLSVIKRLREFESHLIHNHPDPETVVK